MQDKSEERHVLTGCGNRRIEGLSYPTVKLLPNKHYVKIYHSYQKCKNTH